MNNINIAIAEANRLTRAIEIIKTGYQFLELCTIENSPVSIVAVVKPGSLGADYFIRAGFETGNGCNCPDKTRTGRACKHEMALEIKKDEEEMMNALCAEWEARQLIEA